MIAGCIDVVESFVNKIIWLEWGKDSFEKARSSGKPILLDITGSWCHWCHVMDETSYSDQAIVNTVNKNFIPIRVDTDQRPDVNRRYNLGGWPTTAFLDSEGKIITGGTYIPPQQLREVLRSVLEFYSANKGRVVSKLQTVRLPTPKNEPLTEKITKDIATTIAVNFDMDYGGFGFEPKFPHTEALEYAMLRHRYFGEKDMLTMVARTLDKMGSGGVYDQVEQGFFRYSTTRDWSIPHFEKMAEDNAKLLAVYLHALQLTGKTRYKEISEGIISYALNILSDKSQGGFYGSQDADEKYYSLDMTGRRTQKSPAIDKTLYTNYNALFASSFLLAATILGNRDLGEFALKTLNRIMGPWMKESQPSHYWSENQKPFLNGLLVDYATLINSMLDAYEYSGKQDYLERAASFAKNAIQNLNDPTLGGFYDIQTSDSNLGELKARDKPIDENSTMALGLLRLSWITGNSKFSEIAEKALRLYNSDYERYGISAATYAIALDSCINGATGVTIVGSSKSKLFSSLKEKALSLYSGRKYVLYLDPEKDAEKILQLGYEARASPVAYICSGKTCGPPVGDPSQVETTLTSLLAPKPVTT